jgi:hypothetical protein
MQGFLAGQAPRPSGSVAQTASKALGTAFLASAQEYHAHPRPLVVMVALYLGRTNAGTV